MAAQLFRLYHFSPPQLLSVREHNEREQTAKVLAWLAEGKKVALVSDAGTPAISDPGARLVRAVHEAGFFVCPIVGASALTAAVSAAGLLCESFLFYGFLPAKMTARRHILSTWREVEFAVVIYEAPHRLLSSVRDMLSEFGGERGVIFARELTKTFETIVRATLAELLTFIEQDSNQTRGEVVLIIEPVENVERNEEMVALRDVLSILLQELPTKQAANLAAKLTGASKKTAYDLALTLKSNSTKK